MSRKSLDGLRELQRRHGVIRPRDIQESHQMKQPAVAGWLQRLRSQKKIIRTGHGQYQLVGGVPKPEALIGIPVARGVSNQLMYEAEVALLGAIRCLTRVVDHAQAPSLRNFALGAIAAQNQQLEVIRLARVRTVNDEGGGS